MIQRLFDISTPVYRTPSSKTENIRLQNGAQNKPSAVKELY